VFISERIRESLEDYKRNILMKIVVTDSIESISNNSWINKLKSEAFGIILPDGWFGRPFDNQHKIKDIFVSKNQVNISFDQVGEIQISKPKAYELRSVNTN
jgi:hypothetical protein